MAACKLPAELASWIAQLANMLHGRVAWRLLPLLVGALFARGRKTVASWLRGGRLGGDFKAYYYFLGSLGRNVKSVAAQLFRRAIQVVEPGERLLLAIDDTPTKRYGRHVEGAGIHHNRTPGPARAIASKRQRHYSTAVLTSSRGRRRMLRTSQQSTEVTDAFLFTQGTFYTALWQTYRSAHQPQQAT